MKRLNCISNYELFILEAFLGFLTYFQNQLNFFPQKYYSDFHDAFNNEYKFLIFLFILEIINLFRIIRYKKASISIPFLLFVFYNSILIRHYDDYSSAINSTTATFLFLIVIIRFTEIVYIKMNKESFRSMYKNMLFASLYDTAYLVCYYILI